MSRKAPVSKVRLGKRDHYRHQINPIDKRTVAYGYDAVADILTLKEAEIIRNAMAKALAETLENHLRRAAADPWFQSQLASWLMAAVDTECRPEAAAFWKKLGVNGL